MVDAKADSVTSRFAGGDAESNFAGVAMADYTNREQRAAEMREAQARETKARYTFFSNADPTLRSPNLPRAQQLQSLF